MDTTRFCATHQPLRAFLRLLLLAITLSLVGVALGCGGEVSSDHDASSADAAHQDAQLPDAGPDDVPPFQIGSGSIYHVALAADGGNDETGDGSEAHPFRTINKAISVVVAGDTINVHAGTYVEDTTTSPYRPPQVWMDNIMASMGALTSGTPDEPITLRAQPGDEGQVTIDSEGLRVGMHANDKDYWQIYGLRFVNNAVIGIASWGHIADVLDLDAAATGWRVENNLIRHTTGPWGMNVSGIGMWGSKDWIVRNNHVVDVHRDQDDAGACVQAYGVVGALVEHNQFDQCTLGVFWKDHFVKDANTREKWTYESEIRYNQVNASVRGLVLGIRGSGSTEASNNYWHHNIVVGASESGIREDMAGSGRLSGFVRVEHNLVVGTGGGDAIFGSATESLTLAGNIIVNVGMPVEFMGYTLAGELTASDYNVFGVVPARFFMDRYDGNSAAAHLYGSLAEWQMAQADNQRTLGTDFPDTHSVEVDASTIFVDLAGGDYHLADGSPAAGLMPDGTNAGPYQHGNEIIGLLPSYQAGQ